MSAAEKVENLKTEKSIVIKLVSFDYRLLDSWVKKVVKLAVDGNANVRGPVPLPTERKTYTVLKSPHANKPSMEHFEKKEHKRLVIITNYSMSLVSEFQKLNLPSSLDLNLVIN